LKNDAQEPRRPGRFFSPSAIRPLPPFPLSSPRVSGLLILSFRLSRFKAGRTSTPGNIGRFPAPALAPGLCLRAIEYRR